MIQVYYHYHHITRKLKDLPSLHFIQPHTNTLANQHIVAFHNPLKIEIIYLSHWLKSTIMTHFNTYYSIILIIFNNNNS